jgi:branched-subunit amino acid transport protein
MSLWLIMLAAGLLTFLTRLSFISLFSDREMPPPLQRALGFVPPAVLTAIIFPELLLSDGELAISADNTRLLAGMVAILVAWITRRIMPTIVVGMGVLWLLQYLS